MAVVLLAGSVWGQGGEAPETRTAAQILKAYGARNHIRVEYLPDGARLASATTVTVPPAMAQSFVLDGLNEQELRKLLLAGGLVIFTEEEVWSELSNYAATRRFVERGSAEKVLYVGSAEGELVVLRRAAGCKVEAATLLGLAGKFKDKLADTVVKGLLQQDKNGSQQPSWGQPLLGLDSLSVESLVSQLTARLHVKTLSDVPIAAPPDTKLPEVTKTELSTIQQALNAESRKVYEEVRRTYVKALGPLPSAFDCDLAGLTVSQSPAISVVLLQKLLAGAADVSSGFEVEFMQLDKDGRFVAPYSLRHAWSEDFDYQRAYAAAGSLPALKVAGVRSIVESSIKDYFGAEGIAEPTSAAAPKVPNLVVLMGDAITVPKIAFRAQSRATPESPGGDPKSLPVDPSEFFARSLINLAGNTKDLDGHKLGIKLLLNLLSQEAVTLRVNENDFQMPPSQARLKWRGIAMRSGLRTEDEAVRKAMINLMFETDPFVFVPEQVQVKSPLGLPAWVVAEKAASAPASVAARALAPVETPQGTEGPMAKGLSPVATTDASAERDALNRALLEARAESARLRAERQGVELQSAIANLEAAVTQAAAAPPAPRAAAPAAATPAPAPATPAEAHSDTPMLRGSAVLADVANNSLLVVTPGVSAARTVEFMKYLEGLVAGLDAPRKMVEISVAVVDTDSSIAEQWGTRFAVAALGQVDNRPAFGVAGYQAPLPVGNQPGAFSSILNPAVGVPQLPASTVESTAVSEGLKVGSLIVGSSVQFLATLQALEVEGKGRVLSRPSLLTTDNSEAVLSEETKFYLPATGLNAGTLAEVPVGLKITVTPQVVRLGVGADSRDAVRMRINIKEGTGSGAASLQGLPAGVVAVDNSQLKTLTVIEQGQSLMVAGRLRHEEASGEDRVPVLGRVPVVSRAFKNAEMRKRRQQRLVLITPCIVDSATYQQAAANGAARVFHEPSLPRVDSAPEPLPAPEPTALPAGK